MCLFLWEFLFGQNRSTKFNNLAHWKCTKTAGPDFNSELDEKQRKRFPPTDNGTCFLNKGFKSNKLFIKNLLKDSNFRWWALGWPSWTVLCSQIIKFQFHISCNPTFHPCLWPVIVLQLVSQNCYLVSNEKRWRVKLSMITDVQEPTLKAHNRCNNWTLNAHSLTRKVFKNSINANGLTTSIWIPYFGAISKHCSPLKLLRRLKVLILLILHLIFQWCIEIISEL